MAQAKLQHNARVEQTCPKCKRELERVNRTTLDKIIDLAVPVRRYKCMGCFWEGRRIYRINS